jgi:hypothetical protein
MLCQKISLLLLLLKWPTALIFILFTPAATLLFILELQQGATSNGYFWALLLGYFSYQAAWYLFIRKTSVSFFSTLEHEITHCIFAVITFNRVTGLRATLRDGGRMTYEGSGNWLLTISPYFFPTVTVALLLAMPLVDAQATIAMHLAIGASMAYHANSTWTETHHAQTDLREAGFLFSICFLPTANLLSFSLIFVILRAGWSGVHDSLYKILHSPLSPLQLFELLT